MSASSTLSVVWNENSLDLPLYRFGEGTPGVLIIAGVHGREHSGIQVSYSLAERLAEIPGVKGTIEILPVANPESFAAETRENPVDGKNLGECFSPSGPSRQDLTQTETIAGTVLSLLAFWEYLPQKHRVNPIPPDRVHLRDDRKFIRAWEEGAFYPMCALGEILEKEQRIGTWISLEHLKAVPVVALESGLLIYIRTRCRSHSGDTLAMLLPEVPVQGMKKE